MRWKDNFYFYFSIALLIFTGILIYHFYEMNFKWSETLDVKTILQVIGTIFGAYLGARTAGKFAIKSVEKQIENQESREIQKEQRILLKSLHLYAGRSVKIRGFLNGVTNVIDKPMGFDIFVKDYNSFQAIEKFLKTELANLEKIDISQIFSDSHFSFSLILEDVSSMLNYVEYMLEAMKNDDEDLYHLYKDGYFNTFAEFIEDIGKIDWEIAKFNN